MTDTLFDVQLRIVGDRVDYVKSHRSPLISIIPSFLGILPQHQLLQGLKYQSLVQI